MYNALKASLLAVYLLAVIAAFGVLPPVVAMVLQRVAVALVVAHVLELVAFFGRVRGHPGPLIDSVALTLLFGFLHWKPLPRAAA